MARFIYGSNDISASTFPSWSNEIAEGSGNISQSIAFGDFFPAQSSPDFGIQILQGASVFYGNVIPETGGTVEITAPYSVAATTSTVTVKNLDISANSITLYARANYPHAFDSWRTAAEGGGSSIATTTTVTLTDASIADHDNYYAHFTTTHTNAADSSGFQSLTMTAQTIREADACDTSLAIGNPYRYNGDENNNTPVVGDIIYTGSSGTTPAPNGVYAMMDAGSRVFIKTSGGAGSVVETGSCS